MLLLSCSCVVVAAVLGIRNSFSWNQGLKREIGFQALSRSNPIGFSVVVECGLRLWKSQPEPDHASFESQVYN